MHNKTTKTDLINWGNTNEWLILSLLIFIAGLIAKLPFIFNIDPEWFYPRNIGSIIFPILISYISWRNKANLYDWGRFMILALIPIIYLNLLPGGDESHTFFLAFTHALILFISIYGYVFIGGNWKTNNKRISFLHYCGDLVVLSGLILISGGLFTVTTLGLFEMIGFEVEDFYFENFAVWGLPAIPLLASFLILNNSNIVSKISPIIAKIFTPLVFIILLVFSIAANFSDKDVFADRELLLLFNLIIIAVMALIIFSLSQASSKSKFQLVLLLSLSLVCIIDNFIALSAISSRIFEFGITPNRVTVTGLNLLVLCHLGLIARQLFLSVKGSYNLSNIETAIVTFLPIYTLWAFIITFLFPLIFNFI